MSGRDALKIKEQIIEIFKRRGPSLPVHIAKETELSILFASAFLSELISDKRVYLGNRRLMETEQVNFADREEEIEKLEEEGKTAMMLGDDNGVIGIIAVVVAVYSLPKRFLGEGW